MLGTLQKVAAMDCGCLFSGARCVVMYNLRLGRWWSDSGAAVCSRRGRGNGTIAFRRHLGFPKCPGAFSGKAAWASKNGNQRAKRGVVGHDWAAGALTGQVNRRPMRLLRHPGPPPFAHHQQWTVAEAMWTMRKKSKTTTMKMNWRNTRMTRADQNSA